MVTVIAVLVVAVIAGYAIWRNMSDGNGNNRIHTRNRGISGERRDDYRDNDLS